MFTRVWHHWLPIYIVMHPSTNIMWHTNARRKWLRALACPVSLYTRVYLYTFWIISFAGLFWKKERVNRNNSDSTLISHNFNVETLNVMGRKKYNNYCTEKGNASKWYICSFLWSVPWKKYFFDSSLYRTRCVISFLDV